MMRTPLPPATSIPAGAGPATTASSASFHPSLSAAVLRRLATPAAPKAMNASGVATRRGLMPWVRAHRAATVGLLAGVATVATVAAVLVMQLNVSVASAAKAPPVVFQNGGDYTTIHAAGFATLTLGTSGTSASLSLSGVSGAASVSLGNVMKLTNSDATVDQTVTLTRSTTLNAAITSFVVTVKNGGSTLVTWDAVSSASSSSFTLPANTATDVTVALVITDGTATGSLGSFAIQAAMTPA